MSVGASLVAFCVFLYLKLGWEAISSMDISWLFWSALILGSALLTVSFLSFSSLASEGCRWAVLPSSYIAILAGIVSFSFGIALAAKEGIFSQFLRERGSDFNISNSDISSAKFWYAVVTYCLIGLSVLQVIRFYLSESFFHYSSRVDGEFSALLEEEDQAWERTYQENKSARALQYEAKREYYRSKYSSA
jgi:hypothetical protein